MITIQHALVTFFSVNGDMDKFRQELPYALLPDAIRMYTRDRQYSHFETALDGDTSWIQFPSDIRNINQEMIDQAAKHLTDPSARPTCVIGEDTQIDVFEDTNVHLPEVYRTGVAKHLIQDICFDDFVRTEFDCSRRFQDEFGVCGQTVNGAEFRKIIATVEQYGYYLLAQKMYEEYGITANQEWLDKTVRPILEAAYPPEMAANTCKYMQVNPEINQMITSYWPTRDMNQIGSDGDRDHFLSSRHAGLTITEDRFHQLYDQIAHRMEEYLGREVTEMQKWDRRFLAEKKLDSYDAKSHSALYNCSKSDSQRNEYLKIPSLQERIKKIKEEQRKEKHGGDGPGGGGPGNPPASDDRGR